MKRTHVSKTSPRKFEGVADLFAKLEVEAEKVVRHVIDKAEHSSRELKKGVSTLIEQVRNQGFATLATEKKEEIVRIAEDVVARAKEIQFVQLGNLNRDEIVKEARKNLEDLIAKINARRKTPMLPVDRPARTKKIRSTWIRRSSDEDGS